MAALYDFLEEVRRSGRATGNFLGLLHLLIGRRVAKQDGTVISAGLTWREVAAALKKVRWEKVAVRDLGLDPATLPPRDRLRYWYTAIARAQVDSKRAIEAGNRLAEALQASGYMVGASPHHEKDKSPA
jgi:hypothetical protein